MGYLEAKEVVQARAVYDELSLTKMPQGIRSSVERIAGWLRAGAEARQGLVGVLF
jgi:hypothetical protein